MKQSQRIPALDVAKGIGIICVVLGHSMNINTVPGMFFYTFHMPLFFLLSGMCFSPERNRYFRPFLTKRFRQLVVPAFLFATLIIAVGHAVPRLQGYDLSLLLWEGLPHALWFLIVLFAVEIAFFWIVKLFNRGGYAVSITLLCFALGLVLAHYELCAPYSVFVVPTATGFYAVGYLMRPYVVGVLQYRYRLLLALACFVAVLARVVLMPHLMQMYANLIVPLDIPFALIGIAGVLWLSAIIADNTLFQRARITGALLWLGCNTLAIMGIQQLFIGLSFAYIDPLTDNYKLQKLLEALFVWTAIVITTHAINRHATWLVGKKRIKQ